MRFLLFLFFSGSCLVGFAQQVTYNDVRAILQTKCVSCHKPGEGAPFNLQTYQDVKKRATFVKHVIETGYMPPWKADTDYRDYANDRSLTSEEKKKLVKWIEAGAPEGTPQKTKPVPNSESAPGIARLPDLQLKIDSSFTVKGDNTERFIVFKIPYELAKEQAIEAVEFYSNNKKVIHHVNYGFYNVSDPAIDIRGGIKRVDTDAEPEKEQEFARYKKDMNFYTGWIPGASVEYYPKDFGWMLPKRGVVLVTVHYSAIAASEESIVGVNLFFKDKPVQREVRIISLGSGGIGEEAITPRLFIYPNKISTFRLTIRTPEDQSLLYVWPHMHLIGKEFTAYAVTPQRDTINLVHIPAWDFRWQELYRFKKLVRIPPGSMVHMSGTYDNTAQNPFNPNKPPQYVYSTGNMRSSNEMFTLLLIYSPYKEGDENISLE